MTGAPRLSCWLLALAMLCPCATAHSQSAPDKSPADSQLEACTQDAPFLLLSVRLAKQSLMNSALAGTLHGTGWRMESDFFKKMSDCTGLAAKMRSDGKPVPSGLSDLVGEHADLVFLFSVFHTDLPTDLPDRMDWPACKRVLDSRIIDRAWTFVNAANPSTVNVGDVMPYVSARHDLILCSTEATGHGMPSAAVDLLRLASAIDDLTVIAETNSEARLLKNVSPTATDRPVKIQIQVLPPAGHRVSPPQTCSGTVYGEGPLRTINWECF